MAVAKRGQEGLTLTTLLLIVLGIVVVVVVIIGFTTGFDFIFGNLDRAPVQGLEVLVQSCTISANNELKADYCVDLKEVELDGQEQYVTCNYLRASQGALFESNTKGVDCGASEPNAATFCESENLKDDEIVLGQPCSFWRNSAPQGD